jgi:ABC-type Zn uptake system ZnuABC Zn-binding protein ZnuA
MRFSKMKVTFLFVFLCSFILLLSSNSQNRPDLASEKVIPRLSSATKIRVVCSISIIEDFVANLVNNTGLFEYSCLIKGQQDPHTYEAKQTDIYSLIQADILIIFNQSDLESFWVPGEDSPNMVPPTKATVLQDNPDLIVISITNSSMEKYDPFIREVNAHMWMDPLNGKMMVRNLYWSLKPFITDAAILAIS